MLSVLWHITS